LNLQTGVESRSAAGLHKRMQQMSIPANSGDVAFLVCGGLDGM
jgi:hypothetical protein